MRATVRDDTTTRLITVEVSGVPDVNATKSWHAEGTRRIFRPDHVSIRTVDNEFRELTASGPLVKVNGELSQVREDMSWHPGNAWQSGQKLSEAPEWVRTLAREAPAGVTAWGQPEEVPA